MKKIRITAADEFRTGKIDNRIFGSFIEHIGRAVYGGIYEPGHPQADSNGFRRDVISLIKELGVSVVRYPGGNFVSGYNWEDGIGPIADRPKRLELAWETTETNEFGTNEFINWCRTAGTEPMFAVNLGTRGMDAARNLVEYCNHTGGSYWSDLRRSHGCEQPHGIKLWCLGNEMDGNWQMGSKTPVEYGRLAYETSKIMKMTDKSIETVLCGSSNYGMKTFGEWEATALGIAYEAVDYVSLHQYFGNGDNNLENFLARPFETENYIKSVIATCDYVQGKLHSKKRIDLSFDEWNVWYHSNGADFEKWSKAPHFLEDVYDFADVLVVGMMLNSMLRHCDRVRIACLAQLVNVIAPIMTENNGSAWRQTTFYPFMLAAKYCKNGSVLKTVTDCPVHDTRDYSDVPDADAVCVVNDERNEISVICINRCTDESMLLELKLLDFEGYKPVEHTAIEGYDLRSVNTKEHENVVPRSVALPVTEDGVIKASLSPLSWNIIRLKK